MKRSELKEAIKAEIKSILSEEITEAKFVKFKGDSDDNKMEVKSEREMNTPDGELKVYTVRTDDGLQSYTADQVELVEGDIREVSRWLEDKDQNERASDKYARFNRSNASYESGAEALAQKQFDDDAIDKKASIAAKSRKKDSVATISTKLQKLTAKMKDKAKEYKAAEGEAKEKIKDELKAMTAEKKKLEKSL